MESWTFIWFDHFQTKRWRPGDILHIPERTEDIIGAFKTQRIKWRITWNKLPYLDLCTSLVKRLQQLFPYFLGLMETYWKNLEIPKPHHYMPKLSRFKTISKSPSFSQIPQSSPTASFEIFLICFVCFLLFSLGTLVSLFLRII